MDLRDLFIDIYLLRHGDPASQLNHWSTPKTPLSELGMSQSKILAKHLSNCSFDALITSPFARAKQTAEFIIKQLENPLHLEVQPWLGEIDLGDWTGKLQIEVEKNLSPPFRSLIKEGYSKRGPLVARLLSVDKDFRFPSGESLRAFWQRVSEGFMKTLDLYRAKSKKTIGFVGHGGSLTIILLNLLNKAFLDMDFPIILFEKANFTKIRIFSETVFILQVNPLINL